MSNRQATARPWRVMKSAQRGYTIWADVSPTGSMQVAATGDAEFDLANADLIVTAVNERDALLAEVRIATERFESEHETLTRVVSERNDLREEVCRLRKALQYVFDHDDA